MPALVAALGLLHCSRPPPSVFPSAEQAIERMRDTGSCSRGLSGEAKLDYFHEQGRARGDALYIVSRPDRLRFDVVSPFGVPLSTVVSDGHRFALLDLKQRSFLHGPAKQCNLAKFIRVPVPPHALVRLLSGEAPVLVHAPTASSIEWSGGRYVIEITGEHQARQRIELEPHPDDWNRSYAEQRIRVLAVEVEQAGYLLYRAELRDHVPAAMSKPRVDEDGIDADLPPSGPECRAEVPRNLRFLIADETQDLTFEHKAPQHNPPLGPGVFELARPSGVSVVFSDCPGL